VRPTGLAGTANVGAVTAIPVTSIFVSGVSASANVGKAFVWGNIVPGQDPSYSTEQPSQSPGWTEEQPSQSPDWLRLAA